MEIVKESAVRGLLGQIHHRALPPFAAGKKAWDGGGVRREEKDSSSQSEI